MKTACLVLCLIVSGQLAIAQHLIRNGDPITVKITSVRSISPEERVGFSKTQGVYRVEASSDANSYVAYCRQNAPEIGRTYTALDEFATAQYSEFHLSPVNRRDVQTGSTKKDRMYRILIFQDVSTGPKPDLGCDLAIQSVRQ